MCIYLYVYVRRMSILRVMMSPQDIVKPSYEQPIISLFPTLGVSSSTSCGPNPVDVIGHSYPNA